MGEPKLGTTAEEVEALLDEDRHAREIEARARVQRANLRLVEQGDPLQLRNPKRKKKRVRPINEVTDERMRHARAQGLKLETAEITTEKGAGTGHKRKRFIPQIEQLWKRNVIDGGQYLAATKFHAQYRLMWDSGPNVTAKYGEWMEPGTAELSPIERQVFYSGKVARVQAAIFCKLWPVLEWIGTSMEEQVRIEQLADLYYIGLSKDRGKTKALTLVDVVTGMLAEHYGYDSKWADPRLTKVVQEVADYLGRGVDFSEIGS